MAEKRVNTLREAEELQKSGYRVVGIHTEKNTQPAVYILEDDQDLDEQEEPKKRGNPNWIKK